MNKRIKAQWVKALRAGKYKQAKRQLKDDRDGKDSYCCLGVLCDLHSKSTKKEWVGYSYDSSTADLPSSVIKWAGLDSSDPMVPFKKIYNSLSTLNDDGQSFKRIATLIEKNL